MVDGWGSPAVLVAGIAAAISAGTGVISWFAYRNGNRHDWPSAKLSFQSARTGPRYVSFELTLENESASTWTDIRCEVLRPRGAIYATTSEVQFVQNRTADGIKDFHGAYDSVADRHPVTLTGKLDSFGSIQRSPFGRDSRPADEMRRSILLLAESLGNDRKFSIRVTLLSNDAKPRKHVIPIKRMLPDRPATAES